jgi:Protein of unknown function (DUF2786)
MNQSRQKMLDKVRAILSKTMNNGCTEDEAMAALAKARELMAAYDIDESELSHPQDHEGAAICKTQKGDLYDIRKHLCMSVARFTRCKAWSGRKQNYAVGFAGLESDVLFATWLLETLQKYVLRAMNQHHAERRAMNLDNPRIIGASFVMGCVARISERLRELTPVEPIGKGLIVSRNALIKQVMENAGIVLHKDAERGVNVNNDSLNAGKVAGNGARFDRPVGSSGEILRLR